MEEIYFRLLFEGLEEKAKLEKLVVFFHKELGLDNNRIGSLLTTPPRVLWEAAPHKEALASLTALKKLGCRTSLEPVLSNGAYPFVMPERHHKLIKRELSKIIRCRSSMLVFIVHVEPGAERKPIPSLLGPAETEFAEHFRESDTVVGVDDHRALVLGFATGKEGVEPLERKIRQSLRNVLDTDIVVSMGWALFPEEGRSISELVHLAEKKRQEAGPEVSQPKPNRCLPESSGAPAILTRESPENPLQICFTKARGKIFKRLLEMDPETLWMGLSQLPQSRQEDFLARIPLGAPLGPVLEQMIRTQPTIGSDREAEQYFEAMIHQMDMEAGLEDRKRTREVVLSRMRRAESLPTLPSVASQVFNIASDPNSSAADLTTVIANDPPLTGKLLKVVNSAFYGFPQKIGTVRQAVVILGTEEIVNLSFGLVASKVFDELGWKHSYGPKNLWLHSLCTALLAQHLCAEFPEFRKQGIFTAGLLHDMGKIFLMENFPELYGKIYKDITGQDLPFYELEEEKFGLSHAAIGEVLAAKWNLPAGLVQAIAFHHRPHDAPGHPELAALVGLADYLAHCVQAPEVFVEPSPSRPPELTFGHGRILTGLLGDLDEERLVLMCREAATVINENQTLFKTFETES